MRWVGRRERIATAESTGVQPRGHGVQWTPSEYKEGEPLFFLGVLDWTRRCLDHNCFERARGSIE